MARDNDKQISRLEPLPMDEQGRLVARDSGELRRMANNFIASKALPAHLNTPERVEFAYRTLRGLGMDPAISFKDTWVNERTGVLSVCNAVPLAACRRCPDFVDIEEYLVDAKNERRTKDNFVNFVPVGAVCIAKRKGCEDKVGMFTYREADTAGLRNKNNWKNFGPAMLTMRARTIALKAQFPDVLQGVAILEYDDQSGKAVTLHAEQVHHKTLPPANTSADDFNSMFGDDNV